MIRIRSGGQSGVDRAALDCAVEAGLAYEGWCPAGGWAEDYPNPPGLLTMYPLLIETPSSDPAQRTEWNVRDSDVTLVLFTGEPSSRSPGTVLTEEVAARLRRPCIKAPLMDSSQSHMVARALASILDDDGVLNVAGPRESEAPGAYSLARLFVRSVLDELAASP